ncbi:MAG TPA: hypothetical protein VMB71_11185 [Acetobacteraceae bacterium]|nr:hypothetical protein [Acetobacteraceae bacterium]
MDMGAVAVFGVWFVVVWGANLLFYGGLYGLSRLLARGLRWSGSAVLRDLGGRRGLLFLVVISPLVIIPALLDVQRLWDMAGMSWGDHGPGALPRRLWRLALLMDMRPPGAPPAKPGEAPTCDKALCLAFLSGGRWRQVLVGPPPELGADLDPTQSVTVFQLRTHDANCLKRPGQLAVVLGPGTGACDEGGPPTLVSSQGPLGGADFIVTLQAIPGWPGHSSCVYPGLMPFFHPPVLPARLHWCDPSVDIPFIGQRLTLWEFGADGAHELARATAGGASLWFVPFLVGPVDPDDFLDGLEPGRIDIGVASRYRDDASAPSIDVPARLQAWGVLAAPPVVGR